MSTPAAYLDARSAELVTLLRRLVGVDTVNPPGRNYEQITSLLTDELRRVGLSVRRLPIPARLLRQTLPAEQHAYPRFNVLGKWGVGRGRKTLHFNAHYDVVPVSDGWTHGNPFSGAEDRGWVYGRGTGDMKGSIASLLMALAALRACRLKPAMNLEVSFTADEETDSMLGSGWLVQHGPIQPDYAVVMEGAEGDAICCGHNGVVWLEVVVHGRAAHGSKPEAGVNALEKLSSLVLSLGTYKQQLGRRTFTTPEGKSMVPTVNVGGVFGQGPGGKINTVPAEARFSVDRRVLPNETVAEAERDLRTFLTSAAREIPECSITINKLSDNHPCYSAPTDPFFGAMAEAVSRVRRRPSVFSVSTGFNDMHFFSHHLRIPTLGYGPGGQRHHGTDERVRVADLVSTAKIYAELLLQFEG